MATVANLLAKIGFHTDTHGLEKIHESLDGIRERLDFLSGVEIVKGIFELTERYSGFAEQLGVSATAAGVTVEALQKLQYGAGLAGVSAEDVSTGLAHLTRTLYEARSGSAEAQAAFAGVGIGMAQLNSFKTSQEAMAAFGEGLSHVNDSVKRQALVLQAFGRGGGNMVEFLIGGKKAFEEFGTEAERVGAVISSDSIEKLREMEDAMSTVKRVITSFAATLASYFAPALRDLAKGFLNVYAANRQWIQLRIQEYIGKMAYGFGFLVGLLEGVATRFLVFIRQHETLAAWGAKLGLIVLTLAGAFVLLGLASSAVKIVWAFFLNGARIFASFAIFAAEVAALAAVFLVLEAAAEAFFQLIQMKKFNWHDTLLGQLYDNSDKMIDKFKRVTGIQTDGLQDMAQKVTGGAMQVGSLKKVDPTQPGFGVMAPGLLGPESDLAYDDQQRLLAANAVASKTFNLAAPNITINANSNSTPEEIAGAVTKAIVMAQAQQLRDAARTTNNGNLAQ